MQTIPQRTGFVATVHLLGLLKLLLGPDQKILGRELLRRLRSGVVELPDHPIVVSMNIDAQLDALGFGHGLCFSREVGVGIWFHKRGVALFRSPANTHVTTL